MKYIDCMDPDHGLPSLPDKSVDLCITDPPYNVNAKANAQRRRNPNKDRGAAYKIHLKNDVGYKDQIRNYDDWCLSWFKELKRICSKIIFTPSYSNLALWFQIEKPRDILYHYKRNGNGITSVTWHNRIEIILVYGDFDNLKKPFLCNVFDIPIRNGFLRPDHEKKLVHPHPKPAKLWYEIIKAVAPESVIDPFMGSGTTAEQCIRLGIPWCGYEKSNDYRHDIEARIDRATRSKQWAQQTLKVYLE